ncbi:MAG: ATP-binding protein [Oscillatoria sp. SIO1A7]|nr:ATP-binding protein [Oscillatoria sp. SIO1A7]
MTSDLENPFADYGNIVFGSPFIGRQQSLRAIESRIVRPKEAGNLAIIGEPRIGKSSLIYQAIIQRKDELADRKILPIWINLATYDEPSAFFRELVTSCQDEMEDLGWLTEPIERAASRALEEQVSWNEGYGRIQRFFGKVRKICRVVFILDEFDHARHLFKGNVAGFQGLRELSYRPEWRITFVTASRRSIHDIEVQSGAISTFDGIFQKHYLGMFAPEDFQEYLQRLASAGVSLANEAIERIAFFCGRHPFLLDMLGYEMVELFRDNRDNQSVDVELAAQRIANSFLLDYYDSIVRLLQEDDRLNKLISILFGPTVGVKQTDIDEFMQYGLIEPAPKGAEQIYVGFSEHFHNFLGLVEREQGIGDLWKQTEKALRHLVARTMEEEYGERWVSKLERSHPKLKPIFARCREKQNQEAKWFGSRASQNLMDFASAADLFAIIFIKWESFKSIFGQDLEYWQERSAWLEKVATSLAQNRDESLQEYDRKIAEGYCQEILSLF